MKNGNGKLQIIKKPAPLELSEYLKTLPVSGNVCCLIDGEELKLLRAFGARPKQRWKLKARRSDEVRGFYNVWRLA